MKELEKVIGEQYKDTMKFGETISMSWANLYKLRNGFQNKIIDLTNWYKKEYNETYSNMDKYLHLN